MKNKSEIRKYIKTLFQTRNREELERQNKKIQKNILDVVIENYVQNICIYESMSDEVNTQELIRFLEKSRKNIYIPQMISETEMILIDNQNFEIYEDIIDMFIIPGRAFTQTGKRLGRGKGYYDRFLSQKLYKTSQKIGICYDFQILKDIPCEKHDIQMDKIITSD